MKAKDINITGKKGGSKLNKPEITKKRSKK